MGSEFMNAHLGRYRSDIYTNSNQKTTLNPNLDLNLALKNSLKLQQQIHLKPGVTNSNDKNEPNSPSENYTKCKQQSKNAPKQENIPEDPAICKSPTNCENPTICKYPAICENEIRPIPDIPSKHENCTKFGTHSKPELCLKHAISSSSKHDIRSEACLKPEEAPKPDNQLSKYGSKFKGHPKLAHCLKPEDYLNPEDYLSPVDLSNPENHLSHKDCLIPKEYPNTKDCQNPDNSLSSENSLNYVKLNNHSRQNLNKSLNHFNAENGNTSEFSASQNSVVKQKVENLNEENHSISNVTDLQEAKSSSFWKESPNVIPGNARKKLDVKSKPMSPKDSFEAYTNSVTDAWDSTLKFSYLNLKTCKSTVLKSHDTKPQPARFKLSDLNYLDVSVSVPNTIDNFNSSQPNHNPGAGDLKSCPGNAKPIKSVQANFKQTQRKMKQTSEDLKPQVNPKTSLENPSKAKLKKQEMKKILGSQSLSILSENTSEETLKILKEAMIKKSLGDYAPQLRLKAFLSDPTTLEQLQKLTWNGISEDVRPLTWKILSKYIPLKEAKRESFLNLKRREYWSFVSKLYQLRFDPQHKDTFHQIHIDVPRMRPFVPIFQNAAIQEMFERILFLWAMKYPASGYVQGINDLATPFFLVFSQEYTPALLAQAGNFACLEADIFWCLSKFMAGIQENYIFAQTGIQKNINKMKNLIKRIDLTLHQFLERNDVNYIQFAFRWFNNLLTRELPIKCIIRLWDTYLSEGDYFPQFLPYVCASFLLYWRNSILRAGDFQCIMMLLQNLPTEKWGDYEVSVIVAEAYKLKVMFADAPKHLEQN